MPVIGWPFRERPDAEGKPATLEDASDPSRLLPLADPSFDPVAAPPELKMPPGAGAGAGADLGTAAPVRAEELPLGSRLGVRPPELLEDAAPTDPDDDPDDDELPDEALPELVVPLEVEPDEPDDELPAVVPGRATAWAQTRAGHERPIATASTVALRMDEVMTPSPESA